MANPGGKNPFDHPYFTKPTDDLLRGKRPVDDPFSPSLADKQSGPQKQKKAEEKVPKAEEKVPGYDADFEAMWSEFPGMEIRSRKKPTGEFQKLEFAKVPYDELFYTSYYGIRIGEEGTFHMEIEEEERTVGESLHTSKGNYDKGHSVTTKQCSYGRVDSMQIDELAGSDEKGKGNAVRVSSQRSTVFNLRQDTGSNRKNWYDFTRRGARPFTSLEQYGAQPDGKPQVPPSREASSKNIRIE